MHTMHANFIEKYDFRTEKWVPLNSNQKNECNLSNVNENYDFLFWLTDNQALLK